MGTWGEGLYDNDSALDELGDLLALGDEQDGLRLVVRIGLQAWMNPVHVAHDSDELKRRVDACDGDLAHLPADTRAALVALLADPEAATEKSSRTPEAKAVIGGYCDGPRIDVLLRFPGAQGVLDEFGESLAKRLDGLLAVEQDLYEVAGSLAVLGVLIELSQAGLWQPAASRVAIWRAGFDAIDKATKSERGFWWKYVRRVRAGFDLLAPRPATAAPARPQVRRPRANAAAPAPAQAGPVQRFLHPKLGTAILVARSGSGDDERLDLRFEDGQIRKILARFVTPVDG